MIEQELVSVVIPAYNAAATLDETLCSVRGQSHRALEIIVVDDGSTDGTRALAERHAAADARVSVLHQANAGVAAARNAGWRQARAQFIAFVDADDLWAPTKIERQLAALKAHGDKAGLAYCWTARIDLAGSVIAHLGKVRHEGCVLDAILRSNFVASGSAALVRRQALIDSGGFDTGLRAAGGEGCEDWLFYARVAGAWHYVLVPDYLVGYRERPDNMSSNRMSMLHSHLLMCLQMQQRHPEHGSAIRRGLRSYGLFLMRVVGERGGWRAAAAAWSVLLRGHPRVAFTVLSIDLPLDQARRARSRLGRLLRRRAPLPPAEAGRRFLPSRMQDAVATHE